MHLPQITYSYTQADTTANRQAGSPGDGRTDGWMMGACMQMQGPKAHACSGSGACQPGRFHLGLSCKVAPRRGAPSRPDEPRTVAARQPRTCGRGDWPRANRGWSPAARPAVGHGPARTPPEAPLPAAHHSHTSLAVSGSSSTVTNWHGRTANGRASEQSCKREKGGARADWFHVRACPVASTRSRPVRPPSRARS